MWRHERARADPVSGAPFALRNFGDEGGERAATHDLLERRAIRGRVIPLDTLHTTRTTAKRIPERSGADDVFSVQGHAPETFDLLDRIHGERDATGPFTENLEKAHGRREPRSLPVLTPLQRRIHDPGVRPIARIPRSREPQKKKGKEVGKDDTETA